MGSSSRDVARGRGFGSRSTACVVGADSDASTDGGRGPRRDHASVSSRVYLVVVGIRAIQEGMFSGNATEPFPAIPKTELNAVIG